MSHCWQGDSGTDGGEGSIWGRLCVQSEFPAFVYLHEGFFFSACASVNLQNLLGRMRNHERCASYGFVGECMKLKWLLDDCEAPTSSSHRVILTRSRCGLTAGVPPSSLTSLGRWWCHKFDTRVPAPLLSAAQSSSVTIHCKNR